jgi:hypothetical protein
MATVVGFDFGTHQTKVCIANNDDPRNVIYDFLFFHDETTNTESCLFPSFVQINKDHTLSYGWADQRLCLKSSNPALASVERPPILKKPAEPVLKDRPQPPAPFTRKMAIRLICEVNHQRKTKIGGKKKGIPMTEENINQVIDMKTKQLEKEYNSQLKEWSSECAHIQKEYEKTCADIDLQNEYAQLNYDRELAEANELKEQKYLNFKYLTFNGQETRNLLSATQVSILYITYILFHIEKLYGQDFSIQFGVPASPKTYRTQRRLATQILLCAIHLVEDVFKNDYEKYLSSTYEDLIPLLSLPVFSEEDKEQYGIIILPEASACLTSIVTAGKLTEGKLHLMMDIGGGTTDISFFAVNEMRPIIYWFKSIPLGLNFIRENPQNLAKYKETIKDTLNKLKRELIIDFAETEQPLSYMEDNLYGNMLIYNGGGSSDKRLCVPYIYFQTLRRISDILPISFRQKSLVGLNHILSNAYGLSHQVDDEDLAIKLQPFDQMLLTYKEQIRNARNTPEHHYKYDHGLSDWD